MFEIVDSAAFWVGVLFVCHWGISDFSFVFGLGFSLLCRVLSLAHYKCVLLLTTNMFSCLFLVLGFLGFVLFCLVLFLNTF